MMSEPTGAGDNLAPPVPGRRHFGLFLRAGLFLLFIRFFGSLIASVLVETIGYFPAAALSFFLAAAIASAFMVRTFERGRLEDIGMGWTRDSKRHLLFGTTLGIAGALFVTLGAADLGSGIAGACPGLGLQTRPSPVR